MSCNMPNSRGLTFLLILLTAVFLPAQEKIEWEPVAGADHYLVEIRQNGELVLETQSRGPFLPLFLPPGSYDFQIGVVDTFGNVKFTGESNRLKVSAPLIPFIVKVSPQIIHRGTKPMFTAQVSGLMENKEQSTIFVLENTEDERLPLDWEVSGLPAEGEVEITLSGRKTLSKAGIWHLIMTNPDGREDRFENALTIVDPRVQISSMSPRKFAAGNPAAVLRLRVKGFSGDANLVIEGPSTIPVAKLNQGEEGVFEFSLNLSDVSKGQYLISLINPPREIDTGIYPPNTVSSKKVLKIEKKFQPISRSPSIISRFPNAIYGGWKPIIRTSGSDSFPDFPDFPGTTSSETTVQPKRQPYYAGFSLGYSRDIGNISQGKHYLGSLEWCLSANYAQHRSTIESFTTFITVKETYHSLAFLLGITYITRFDFPLNLLAMVGFGVDFAFYRYSHDMSVLLPELDQHFRSNFPQRNSMRSLMSFDLGLRWNTTPRLFINAAANAVLKNAINGNNEWSIQPRVEGGWEW